MILIGTGLFNFFFMKLNHFWHNWFSMFMLARESAQTGKTALDWANGAGKHDVARLIEVCFATHTR